jgi:hypothetical protein
MSEPRERPILFSAPMVLALLAGTKTQTRRAITRQPGRVCDAEASNYGQLLWPKSNGRWSPDPNPCPYGQPGDSLWVRETWAGADGMAGIGSDGKDPPQVVAYRADQTARGFRDVDLEAFDADTTGWNWGWFDGRWRPSIFMPRWASRITLEVTDVRVQRVQDISEADAIAEGITGPHNVGYPAYRVPEDSKPRYSRAAAAYEVLWDSINGKRPGCSWEADPWVWAVSFRFVEPAARPAAKGAS